MHLIPRYPPAAGVANRSGRQPWVFVSLMAFIVLGFACSSSTTSEVTTGPTAAKCQLTLAPPPNIVAAGGTGVVAVTAQPECAWTVSTQASWISNVSPQSGQGDGQVEFVAAANTVPAMREGEIVINDDRVRVSQEAAQGQYGIDPEGRTMASGAAEASIAVSTHGDCRWTARSTAEWITITAGVDGSGNGTVRYRVASNGGAARTGTVTIGDRTHTVTQQNAAAEPAPPAPAPPSPPPPPPCTYSITPTSQAIPAAGGSGGPVTVTTAAHCSWTARSNVSWMTITSGATGTGNGSVGFTAPLNNSGAPRIGSLTIAGHTFTVSQIDAAPEPCEYDINLSRDSFPAIGGTGFISVSVRGGCSWTATNSASWITFTSNTSGDRGGRVDFLVLPNPGGARSGGVAVAGQSFSVSQDGVSSSQP